MRTTICVQTPASVWTATQSWGLEHGVFFKIRCFDFFSERSHQRSTDGVGGAESWGSMCAPPEESSPAGQLQRMSTSRTANKLHAEGALQVLVLQLQILGENKALGWGITD